MVMLPFGDNQILTPQEIADVIAYVLAENAAPTAASGGAAVVQPSVPGGPGEAVGLAGDAANGARLFATNCQVCHGVGGKGGGLPSTADLDVWQVVPALVPLPEGLAGLEPKALVEALDLFIEHGSVPEGDTHGMVMLPFGDNRLPDAAGDCGCNRLHPRRKQVTNNGCGV